MRAWLYRDVDPGDGRHQLIGADAEAAGRRFETIITRVRQSGKEAVDTLDGPEGSEAVDAIPLNGSNGSSFAVLLLVSPGSELAALVSRIRWSGAAIGALGIALGLGLSYIIADRVTRPVEQLAGVADAIAAGNWSARVPDVDAAGELRTLATAFHTMTHQLADQRDRLVQVERVAAWRELARRLAHELKNPLFPLRLTVDNLRRARTLPAGEFDEVLSESLATLDTGLSNLNTVVGRFSDFSRMPAPEIGSASLNAIVESAVALFRAQLEAPGRPRISVTLDLDPDAATIAADAEQLGRAIQNLVLNAIDAMDAGGTLAIRTRADHAVFHIAVSDTGGGLTAEECTRLFTPYYTTKQHGTGLGLAIVQSVVADHHGKVWVDSAPGRGATFHIELPVGGRPA
jgi:nitrogen fixation/metabolism regulation signal transduction histidine kinase